MDKQSKSSNDDKYSYYTDRADEISVAVYAKNLSRLPVATHEEMMDDFNALEGLSSDIFKDICHISPSAELLMQAYRRVVSGIERWNLFFSRRDGDELRCAIERLRAAQCERCSLFKGGAAPAPAELERIDAEIDDACKEVCPRPHCVNVILEGLDPFFKRVRGGMDAAGAQEESGVEHSRLMAIIAEVRRRRVQSRRLRDKIIKGNLRLVVSVVKKHAPANIPFSDLIQEGNLGLMRAVELFDASKGFKFSTYAAWWIREGMDKAVKNHLRMVRLPYHMSSDMTTLCRVETQLRQECGGEPGDEAVAEAMKVSPERVRELREAHGATVSLDEGLSRDDDRCGFDVIADESVPNPAEEAGYNLMCETLLSIMERLDPKERDVIRKRFGLDDGVQHTLEEVGNEVGVTRERIRQIEVSAMRKLRGASTISLDAYFLRQGLH